MLCAVLDMNEDQKDKLGQEVFRRRKGGKRHSVLTRDYIIPVVPFSDDPLGLIRDYKALRKESEDKFEQKK